ncbi:MAG: L-aspartate oxidase [Bacteroidota bacterium]
MQKKTDFLIIGSGIAGLSFALKVADKGNVIIISKTTLDETSTSYAQGGIAAVTYNPDSYEKHITDTLIAGDGLCDENVVRTIVSEGPGQIHELINWGTNFDKKADGKYDLAMEGGHSEPRILHHKDSTGYEIQRALTSRVRNHQNIQLYENYFALDIITQHHLGQIVKHSTGNVECYGAYILNMITNEIETVLSKIIFMATGGIGNVYQTTTNPKISTGDGIAMIYRAKGLCENMEFVQFHPTSLYNPDKRPSFLITEAMRGFGAILKTSDGKEFMHKYDKRGCLASRDIVARSIDNELKITGDDYVYLDATHLDSNQLKLKFPNIFEKCLKSGINITKDMIPVVPAAHYICGGIKIDIDGRSTIRNLYAGGENASSGLHGANRLASNSLLEAVVVSHKAANHAIKVVDSNSWRTDIPDWNDEGTTNQEEIVLITQSLKELRQILSNYVGIVRSDLRLKRAIDRLQLLYLETEKLYEKSTISVEICELRNAINIGYLISKMAQNRKESRGLHFSIDYPEKLISS